MIRQRLICLSLLTFGYLSGHCAGFTTLHRVLDLPISSQQQTIVLNTKLDWRRSFLQSSIDPSPEQEIQQGDAKESFWQAQRALAATMSNQAKTSLRQEQMAKFEKRRLALVIDTAYIAWFIFCACWFSFENPMTAFSYAFGASMGIAYTYGLGKSVEVLGQSVDDVGATQGAGVGEARFAFLILLFLFVGKFRGGEFGLQEIPSIAGFFTYQIASLNQGLREIND